MKEEGYDIITIDDKDFVIIEKVNLDEKQYFLLNEITNNTLTSNRFIVREDNTYIYPLTEEEKVIIAKYFLNK